MRTRTFTGWMMSLGVLSMLLGSASGAHAGARIIGGTNAPAGSWPAIVGIFPSVDTDYLRTFCGGTLIDPEWVLTAGHCLTNPAADQAAEIDVALGVTNLATDDGQRRDVAQIVRHPGFVDNDTFVDDVALLRLATPATLSGTVAPVGLVSPLRPDLWRGGSPAQVAGWGETGTGPATALQQANVTMISDTTCNGLMGSGSPPIFQASAMVCAGVLAGGTDSCQGDSGGPLTVFDGPSRRLVGAVSWGVGCALPNLPGVYSRLDAYRSFVFGPLGLNVTVPSAPTGVSAVAGVESATVTWNAPADGGRAIQNYGVRVIRDGVPGQLVTLPSTSTQTTLGRLIPGAGYTFTVVAASDAGLGPASLPSAAVVPVGPPVTIAPVNIAPPTIAGEARQGATLTATDGTWNDAATTTRSWERCDRGGAGCVDVTGATGGTLVLTENDAGRRLRLSVVARNAAGASIAYSALTAVILPMAPSSTGNPTIAGPARVGRALTVHGGAWRSSSDPFLTTDVRFAWESCNAQLVCSDIVGAAGMTYTPTPDLVGRRIRARVTGSNPGGSTPTLSPLTEPVLPVYRMNVVSDRVVRQASNGRITITMTVQLEPGSHLRVRLLSPTGRPITPFRRRSRINGALPRVDGPGFVASAPASGLVRITVVAPGSTARTQRTGTLELHASLLFQEEATLRRTVRARF